jgi:hypothetical protein
MQTREQVLTSMGYRPMSSIIWGKPIGYHLLTYELNTNEFTNWFKGYDDTLLRWNSEIYEKDETVKEDFLNFLKYVEACTNTSHMSHSSVFEFLTLIEEYTLKMS